MLKKLFVLLLFATLLMSGICIAQSNPTTFTNTNQPNPEPIAPSFSFKIATEDGHPVGTCPSNSAGCLIDFINPFGFGPPVFIQITLPDIPNHVNQDTLKCTIKRTVVTGTYGCQTSKCQSVTYTATGEHDQDNDDAPCSDADGRVWTLVTTQYYHWLHASPRHYIQFYDGGKGSLSY
jgi:hypothetical protein